MLTFSWLLSLSGTIGLLFTLGFCIRICLVVVTVTLNSMSPTLEHGDRVLVLRYWPREWLRKGQIVLARPWNTAMTGPTPFMNTLYIKRIVGLTGETFHNVVEYDPFALPATSDPSPVRIWHIPEGHIFVCGDNRKSSVDSRSLGPLPIKNVLGVVLMKLSRRASLSSIGKPLPPEGVVDRQDHFSVGLPVGQDAPPFTAQKLDGEHVSLSAYSGCTLLIFFIAPSPFCGAIIPKLLRFVKIATKADITVIFVSSASVEPTRPFVDKHKIPAPVLVAPRSSNPFLHIYRISTTPAYCLINEQGKIQATGHVNSEGRTLLTLADTWRK